MSASLTADSIYINQHDLSVKTVSLFKGPLFISRYLFLLKVMLNPCTKVYVNRLKLIRKLGWSLIAFQVLDGLLTYFGLYLFGHDAEGNPLVRSLIDTFGVEAGISICKLCTIVVIMLILVAGHKIDWLCSALKSLLAIYFVFALLPWSYLILQAI